MGDGMMGMMMPMLQEFKKDMLTNFEAILTRKLDPISERLDVLEEQIINLHDTVDFRCR
jgi:hypothetical protein